MIYLVGGARPNFMKIAAISRAFENHGIEYDIIHTGQHNDYEMGEIFFEEFKLKKPVAYLGISGGTHGEQTGRIMEEFENFCLEYRQPDLVFTVGDVNSTMAAALVASKLHIPIAHQEAGKRSFDRSMPEEINRIVTDHVSDYLFPISPKDRQNLINEGIEKNRIYLVGDVMIDNLFYYIDKVELEEPEGRYALVEIHRPANVDDEHNLRQILLALQLINRHIKIIFSLHPRTEKMIEKYNLTHYLDEMMITKPMGYLEFISHLKHAKIVITDSDGIQQETTALKIPCISIRDTCNIEYTVLYGTNVLVEVDPQKIYSEVLFSMNYGSANDPEAFPEDLKKLNDGRAATRIAEVIKKCKF